MVQSWAKVAIGYDKMGQPDLAKQAQQKALAEIEAAIEGFSNEKPTPDDESVTSATTLRTDLEAPDFYASSGCAP